MGFSSWVSMYAPYKYKDYSIKENNNSGYLKA